MTKDQQSKTSFLAFLKKNKLPLGIMLVSLGALIFFSWGFIANLIYFADPRHQNQPLEFWMTPRYVAMSYELPPEIVGEVMGLTPKVDKFKRLSDVTNDLNITLEELQRRVLQAQKKHLEELDKNRPKEKPPRPKKKEQVPEPKT